MPCLMHYSFVSRLESGILVHVLREDEAQLNKRATNICHWPARIVIKSPSEGAIDPDGRGSEM